MKYSVQFTGYGTRSRYSEECVIEAESINEAAEAVKGKNLGLLGNIAGNWQRVYFLNATEGMQKWKNDRLQTSVIIEEMGD